MGMVYEADISTIRKFRNLQSLLKGEARSIIQGLSHTVANYEVACSLLKERFSMPEIIIFAHIQALLNRPHVLRMFHLCGSFKMNR